MMKCACYKCQKEVEYSAKKHFTSKEGWILCPQCSIGVAPCSDRLKKFIIESQK